MRKRKAFGIIEVLVASTVIVTVLFTLTAAGSSSLRTSDLTQQRAQAIYLAQEGLEIVRQIRDTNWIDRDPNTEWDSLVYDPASGTWSQVAKDGSKYAIAFDGTIKRFYLAGNPIDDDGETIRLADEEGMVFTRKITISSVGDLLKDVSSDDSAIDKNIFSMRVNVDVTMPSGKQTSISEILTNWRPQF